MEAMADDDATRARRYRDSKRGKPARQPAPCGTYAAYRRHQRKGEPIDDACRQAYTDYQRELQQARRAKNKPNQS